MPERQLEDQLSPLPPGFSTYKIFARATSDPTGTKEGRHSFFDTRNNNNVVPQVLLKLLECELRNSAKHNNNAYFDYWNPPGPRGAVTSSAFPKVARPPRVQRTPSSRAIEFTSPGETTSSTSLLSALRSFEALAPLHIVLPVNIPYGKILVAKNGSETREAPLHHYYFRQQFPSANLLFSRLHGLSNQSPAWLALDVGYIACREHQVARVADLFSKFFRRAFESMHDTPAGGDNHPGYIKPIRLQCSGLRMRQDHGSGWFLYETPVEACSVEDAANFKEVMRLMRLFSEQVRSAKLCQIAMMKPFTNNQLAIVIVKQEGSPINEEKLQGVGGFQCEGVELSEVRLIRHKLQDQFGNALFEQDPRFRTSEIFGRPIAHNAAGEHARFVFARAALPKVVARPPHQITRLIPELEESSDLSE